MEKDEALYRIVDKSKTSVADIQAAAKDGWKEMLTPGTRANAAAVKAGIDLSKLPTEMDDAVEIRPAGAGVGGVEVIVVGLLSKMAYDAWKDIWKHILFPKIRKRCGAIEPVEQSAPAKKKAAVKKAVK